MKSTVLNNIVPNAISLFVKNSLMINTRKPIMKEFNIGIKLFYIYYVHVFAHKNSHKVELPAMTSNFT